MMPKVTVALSVYNVSSYLRESMNCIISQKYTDLEILCIDDASTDETWEILNEYAQVDTRIRLIRQEKNQGLSVSRNLAIREANGEYIVMLDGDDLFAPEMIERAVSVAEKTNAEMVLWDYSVFYDGQKISHFNECRSVLVGMSSTDKLSLLKRPAFMWTRLLKTEVLKKLGIHFTEGLTKQDIPIHWQLVTSLDRISIIPERLVYYRQQPGSTTNRKGKSLFSLAYVMDIVKDNLISNNIYNQFKNEFLRSRLSLLQGMYDCIFPDLKDEALMMVKERLGQDEQAYISNPQNELSSRVRDFYGMLNGDRMALIRYRGLHAIRSIYRFFKKPM